MIEVKELGDFKNILKKGNWKIFGIGGLPETRSEADAVSDNFEVICSRATGELSSVRKSLKVNVFKVKNNSKKAEDILSEKLVQDYINSFAPKEKVAIYIFISSPKIEEICRDNKWRLIASETILFEKLNSKDFFFNLLEKIGLSREFEIFNSDNFYLEKERLFDKFGEKFVLQTFIGAGGRGTFFATRDNYEKVIKSLNLEGPQKILVSFFVEGFDIAITGCVTRDNGVLSGFARHQFIGVEAIVSGKEIAKYSFCGNDWTLNDNHADNIQKQAETFVQKIGNFLKKEGYIGIFGIDFIYDEKRGVLVPLEINPRLIGSYPIETQFELSNGRLPLIGFNILDFLNLKYKVGSDMKSRNRKNLKSNCSHAILKNFLKKDLSFKRNLKGGVYELKERGLTFLREGFQLNDIENCEKEFILTAGVPTKGYSYRENNQLMRILWRRSIKIKNGADIDDDSKRIIESVKNKVRELINI